MRRRQCKQGGQRSMFVGIPISIAIMTSMTAPAFAGEWDRFGVYVGLDGFSVESPHYENELDNDGSTTKSVDIPATGAVALYVGARLHPNFALEGEFDYVPEQRVKVGGSTVNSEPVYSGTVNGKIHFTTWRIQPYVLLGVGALGTSHTAETDLVGRFGVGCDFYVTKNWLFSVSTDYLIGSGNFDDYDQLLSGGGVQYRF